MGEKPTEADEMTGITPRASQAAMLGGMRQAGAGERQPGDPIPDIGAAAPGSPSEATSVKSGKSNTSD
jgi:hypothetical protein